MYGFAGRSFNFMGEVGKTYSIISTQNMQARAIAAPLLPADQSCSNEAFKACVCAAAGLECSSCRECAFECQRPGAMRCLTAACTRITQRD